MSRFRVLLITLLALAIGIAAVKSSGVTVNALAKPKMPSIPKASGETTTTVNLVTSKSPEVAAVGMMQPSMMTPFPAFQTPFLATSAIQGGAGNEGLADLNPINRSGIQALISVQKIGRTETVTGFATGMDPYKAYVSLFYDAGSPGSGPCACIPSNPPPPSLAATCKTTNAPAVNFSQMVIGYWLPLIGSSTRTLQILKAGAPDAPGGAAFVELENIGAVSIREDTQLGTPLPSAPDPGRFQLRSCGKFRYRR